LSVVKATNQKVSSNQKTKKENKAQHNTKNNNIT